MAKSKNTSAAQRAAANKKKQYASNGSSGSSSQYGASSASSSSAESDTMEEETTQRSGGKTLDDLFEAGLKDMYSAEQQLIKALPKMSRAADSGELEDAFDNHLDQTRRHLERIEKIFERLGIEADESEECEAMKGLIKEADEVISDFEMGPVRDSAMIIMAQKIEHYEIASYGSLRELADVLGHQRICDVLNRTLQEEGETDHLLSQLAMNINDYAYEVSEHESQDQDN